MLASDGNDLFWIDENGGVWRDPVGGGGATQLASGARSLAFLYLDATNAYFLGSGGITAVPKDGDGSTATVLIATDAITATASGETAYWMEQQVSSGLGGPTQWTELLKSAPLVAGGTVTTLDTLQTTFPGSISSMAVADSTFFVTESGEALATIPPDGGAPIALGAGCTTILATTGGVYCAGPPIEIVAPNGATTPISSEANQPRGLAVDESNVYWTNEVESGSVVAAPLLGGPYVILGYDAMPIAVAVDDDAVYWSDNEGNIERVMKVK